MPNNKSQVQLFTLSNGLRVVHLRLKTTQLVHCGLFIKTGSRDEDESTNGSAHFIEHALFKGTTRRRPAQLFDLIESVGGELNAYTTRENTAFYASGLKKYVDRGIDLLADMCFHPALPGHELDKERQVIFEEIEMYEDSPDDSIYDEFFSRLFPTHPLGFNILGTKQSLASIGPKELALFMKQHYTPAHMVLGVVGNLPHGRVEQLVDKYLSTQSSNLSLAPRACPSPAPHFQLSFNKDFQQTHCILGGLAYHRYHPKRFALMLLTNLLGGNNMGSRLNLSVREKYGYCYNINASYQAFDDTGVFMVSFGCDEKNLQPTLNIVHKELDKLKSKALGPLLLAKAKRQLQGSLAIANESPGMQMQNMAKGILHFNKVVLLRELFDLIEEVSSDDLLQVAAEVFAPNNLNQLVYIGNNEA
ncbi:MAG: insulinase family protein [Bacteroidetes bacterium]|jgi:predicted Zn-dependent peptidase|nr:insulinase family protein [Bacteroidota bacterium]